MLAYFQGYKLGSFSSLFLLKLRMPHLWPVGICLSCLLSSFEVKLLVHGSCSSLLPCSTDCISLKLSKLQYLFSSSRERPLYYLVFPPYIIVQNPSLIRCLRQSLGHLIYFPDVKDESPVQDYCPISKKSHFMYFI